MTAEKNAYFAELENVLKNWKVVGLSVLNCKIMLKNKFLKNLVLCQTENFSNHPHRPLQLPFFI